MFRVMRTPLRTRSLAAAAFAMVIGLSACVLEPDPPPANPPRPPTTEPDLLPSDAGFMAFGDFGSGGPHQGVVADAMTAWADAHRVDALVTTGDNIYPTGDPSLFEAYLDEPYSELRETRPLWVTLGNHDVQSGHGQEQLDHLGLPSLPYAQELDGVQLLFLDANHPDAAQSAWLDARLSEPGPAFRVVVFHHPAYSCGKHGSEPSVVDAWVPILEQHRVALVLTGHDHLYERFVSANDVTYIVTGAGGKSLYNRQLPCPNIALERSWAVEYHFVAAELRDEGLRIRAVDEDGGVLDEALIER